jgi:hypothetical protein
MKLVYFLNAYNCMFASLIVLKIHKFLITQIMNTEAE